MRKLLILLTVIFLIAGDAYGRSAFGPRHTGMEPPGSPKSIDMSGRGLARTPMGGMGYTDAYGNTLDDVTPQEKKISKRRPVKQKPAPVRPLPDPEKSMPVWSFN